MIVENVDGVQKVRTYLPLWILVDKDDDSENPSNLLTWQDEKTGKTCLFIYSAEELAAEAIAGTQELARGKPFEISSNETIRDIVLALEIQGIEEIHQDRVHDNYYAYAKFTVTDFLDGMKTLHHDQNRTHHPEQS